MLSYYGRYAAATHIVMHLMENSTKKYTPEEAAYSGAMQYELSLAQFGRLVREAKERYGETD